MSNPMFGGTCSRCGKSFDSYEPELNLNCKSVQKRLATSWGYVKAEQAEHTPYCKQAPMCKEPCGNSDCVEQAEQEPVAIIEKEAGFETEVYATGHAASLPDGVFKLYAAPVRTKDLTDSELDALVDSACDSQMPMDMFARAVIAAHKEKNK